MKTAWSEATDVWGESGTTPVTPNNDRQSAYPATGLGPQKFYPFIYYIGRSVSKYDSSRLKETREKDENRSRRKATACFYLLGVLILFFCVGFIVFFVAFDGTPHTNRQNANMEFTIQTTWDSRPVDHTPVKVILSRHGGGNDLNIHVEAPFFNDPPNPGGQAGQPFPKLYNYEVVEAFFLNDQDDYLEVELSPHGQHLLLMLRGERNAVKQELPILYTANIHGNTWIGDAIIPGRYFPQRVTKFNAYAIHGTDPNRVYESLYPVPTGKYTDPDFHKLSYFKSIDFQSLLPSNYASDYHSDEWSSVPTHHHTQG